MLCYDFRYLCFLCYLSVGFLTDRLAPARGIYVPNSDRWPKHFRGMGIRIEDSIAVQAEHPYVLTTEAVKEVVDIEALRT